MDAATTVRPLEAQGDALETALWTAVRSLEERSILLNKLADHARSRGQDEMAARFLDRSSALDRDVQTLRDLVAQGRALEPTGANNP